MKSIPQTDTKSKFHTENLMQKQSKFSMEKVFFHAYPLRFLQQDRGKPLFISPPTTNYKQEVCLCK